MLNNTAFYATATDMLESCTEGSGLYLPAILRSDSKLYVEKVRSHLSHSGNNG